MEVKREFIMTVITTSVDEPLDFETGISANFNSLKEMVLRQEDLFLKSEAEILIDNGAFDDMEKAIDHFRKKNVLCSIDTKELLIHHYVFADDGSEKVFSVKPYTYVEY